MGAIELELLPVPTFVLAVTLPQDLAYEMVNTAFADALGAAPACLIGKSPGASHARSAGVELEAHCRACLEAGAAMSFDQRINVKGNRRWFSVYLVPQVDAATGEVVRITGSLVDITYQKQRERELERAAMTDELTGLANRRGLTVGADDLLDAAEESEQGMGLIVIDLDDFKIVNDRYGHAVGDEVLKEVARRLCRELSTSGLVARIGGDEFVALVPAESEECLRAVKARLAASLGLPLRLDDLVVRLGASIGSALWEPGASLAELLAFADARMYAVKDERRTA